MFTFTYLYSAVGIINYLFDALFTCKKKELKSIFFFLQVITEEQRLDLTFYIVELGLVSGVPVKGELIFRLTCLTEINLIKFAFKTAQRESLNKEQTIYFPQP